ncbi:hypothetical protein [Hymenobacter canadensis]|uniref:Uncharacterized protein n=1 Tax=Hymenobacter canadensis TaxID=2999067 RepID=A0ABY7LVH6_9BACT|nr:hypothetical protein [Hymenobacter canadensis]WBA44383.1 hypothetical protein O3303_21885 [Hymenobacter canadensis]
MSTGEEVIFSILFAILMIGLTYFYARSLLLKSLFLRQLDALHARVTQGLPLEGAEVDLTAIPWQTVVDEASEGVRGRIDQRLFVHPVYRDAVLATPGLRSRCTLPYSISQW